MRGDDQGATYADPRSVQRGFLARGKPILGRQWGECGQAPVQLPAVPFVTNTQAESEESRSPRLCHRLRQPALGQSLDRVQGSGAIEALGVTGSPDETIHRHVGWSIPLNSHETLKAAPNSRSPVAV